MGKQRATGARLRASAPLSGTTISQMDPFEVAIIGAGVHGASAAFHLASRGVRTVIIERTAPAGGPTGRSSAICRAYYTNAFLASVARDSIAMLNDFERHTGRESGFRRSGLLVLHAAEDEATVREVVPRLNEQGIRTDLLQLPQVMTEWPAFDLDGVAVAAFERDAGYADPVLTTQGLFERARERGAAALLGREVTGIEPDRNGWTVRTGDTSVTSERLLIAAGPWSRGLAAMVGADLPLTVERHIVATFAWSDGVRVPAHGDLPNGYYFRPEGDELFLVGPLPPEPTADPDAFDERVGSGEASRLGARVVNRVPGLQHATARGGWASLYDISPDWQPVIGEIAPGVFVDAGTSGHGFKLAPALGRHVADLVTGANVDPELAQFDPARFETARALDAGYGEAKILG
jgi:glycine/D-amino acid oxidase-like deaminating enzyme